MPKPGAWIREETLKSPGFRVGAWVTLMKLEALGNRHLLPSWDRSLICLLCLPVLASLQDSEQTGLFLRTGVKIKLCHANPIAKGLKAW